jgi:hypothetical protein
VRSWFTLKTKVDGLPSKPRLKGQFLGLPSKPRLTVYPGLASKPVAIVLVVWPQNHSLEFSGLGFKIGSCGLATVSWFGPQKQEGYGLLVAPQNQWEDEDDTGHVLIFSGMVCL